MIQLPHYEGLTIENILDFAQGYANGRIMRALPERMDEVLKLPRSYIANVAYTIAGDDFQNWADAKIEARNKKVV